MNTRESVVKTNHKHWEETSDQNAASDYYNLACFDDGGSSLSSIELSELPNLKGLRGLHLQCGIGLETVSLSRLGAQMSGIDFSANAIARARSIARHLGQNIEFEVADVLDANLLVGRQFDFAYTSHGVLRWLPDLQAWAQNICRLLRVGGFLYLFEIHPLVFRLQVVDEEHLILQGNYFHEKPIFKRTLQTHIGRLPEGRETEVAHTDWKLSSIITALLTAGLSLEFIHEHEGTSYARKGLLNHKRGELWYGWNQGFPIPLAFSLLVRRVA